MKGIVVALSIFFFQEMLMSSSFAQPLGNRDSSEPPVVVVKDGTSSWRLWIAADAGQVERFAADELTEYTRQMTGVALERTEDPSATPLIVLGTRSGIRKVELPAAKPGFDGYAISVSPDRIVLAGDNPRGVLYAVYDLLERAGCRWWHPTLDPKDPEVVPKLSELGFAPGTWSEAGRVELRVFNGAAFFNEIECDSILPQIDWAAKNRYNFVSWQASMKPPGGPQRGLEQMRDCGALDAIDKRGLGLHGPCHSFPFFLSTEKYFEKHPEWFGWRDGKRRPHGGEWPAVNYCWSNQEANAEFIRNVETFLNDWPQLKILDPVWIDGGIICQCPKCTERGGANLLIDFFNQLADSVEKSHPDVRVEAVVGYPPVEAPPDNAVSNGKWQGLHAHWGRNNRTSYEDPDYSRKANLLVWRSYFPRFQECSYYAATSHQPFSGPPFLHALEGDTRFIVEQGITGQYVLQYPLGFWWNLSFTLGEAGKFAYYYPDRAPLDELRDYALTYFGPKAGPLVAEYLWMLGANENLEKSYRACRGEADEGDMEWFRSMEELRKRAETLAGEDPVVAYRMAKLGAAQRFLLTWGDSRRKVMDAEKAYEEHLAGTITGEDMRARIAEARAPFDDLMDLAASLEAQYPGTLTAEWLESWYLNRTFRGPLDVLEKKLDGETDIQRSAKPDHVAGPE